MPIAPGLGRNSMKTQENLACVRASGAIHILPSTRLWQSLQTPNDRLKIQKLTHADLLRRTHCWHVAKLRLMSRPCMWHSRGRTCDTGKREKWTFHATQGDGPRSHGNTPLKHTEARKMDLESQSACGPQITAGIKTTLDQAGHEETGIHFEIRYLAIRCH